MFDHLSLGVSDLGAARQFYGAFFSPLGHGETTSTEAELAYGPGGETSQFYIYPVSGNRIAGLGTHIAFRADSPEAVDAAWRAAVANGATTIRAAGRHPDIAPDYYGAVLLDPDGNKLEIVAGLMH